VQFPTVAFVAFFGLALTGAWLLARWPVARKCWLVAAGLLFYASWDTRFVLLLAGIVLVTWGIGRGIARTDGRVRAALLAVGVTADLLALGFFKYYGFFVTSITSGLGRLGLTVRPPLLLLAIPLGLSFYVLQAISYLIEVRRRQIAAAQLIDVATWLAFFPTLTSGPITRASEFLPQLSGRPELDRGDTARAYVLIARGLVKKLVVASFLATAVTDNVFADPSRYNSLTLLIGVYAYAAQIYCDFGGYTDMALGMATLLGFRLPENFDRPYSATSIQDFWSRWHMTLSRWLRDYLFAPFTGRRADRPVRVYASLIGVMLLAGLWHGAGWTFVAFGGVHGVAMAGERWQRTRRRRLRRPVPQRTWSRQLGRRVITFHVVCIGWVFFAAPSLAGAGHVFSGLVANWTLPVRLLTPLLLLTVAGVVALQYLPAGLGSRLLAWVARRSPVWQGLGFAVASVPILAMAPTMIPAFIYYRF
jgi:D-alanyl-lipoteichoic acid acyltransferase DltB (MBOAT superfamily)